MVAHSHEKKSLIEPETVTKLDFSVKVLKTKMNSNPTSACKSCFKTSTIYCSNQTADVTSNTNWKMI